MSLIAVCSATIGARVPAASADQLIVTWKRGAAPQVGPYANSYAPSATAGRISLVTVAPSKFTDTLRAFQSDPNVASVERNLSYQLAYTPNDTNWAQQYGPSAMGMATAWTYGIGAPVTVAVIDSGIDLKHADLARNLWVNPREIANNRKDDDANGYVDDINGISTQAGLTTLQDGFGHGTHVSGIVGATVGNGLGVAGVAPKARIMVIRVYNNDGVGGLTLELVKAIDYAVANGAKVINASWGRSGEYSPALSNAIERARESGVILVAAAGNNRGSDNDQWPFYPASYPFENVISVAASNRVDQLTDFSNKGATSVHIAAPGDSVVSTMPGSRFATMSGTSMAAPHVAGLAAWLIGMRPAASWLQVRNGIINNPRPVPGLSGVVAAGGIANGPRSLEALWPGALPIGEPYFGPLLAEPPAITVKGDTLTCSQGKWSSPPSTFAYKWSVAVARPGNSLTLSDADYGKPITCTVTVTARNVAGSSSGTSAPVVVPLPLPQATAGPKLTGTARTGRSLACSPGTWKYGPLTYEFTWAANGVPIIGANTSTFTIRPSDVGSSVACTVRATNRTGSSTATTAAIKPRA